MVIEELDVLLITLVDSGKLSDGVIPKCYTFLMV